AAVGDVIGLLEEGAEGAVRDDGSKQKPSAAQPAAIEVTRPVEAEAPAPSDSASKARDVRDTMPPQGFARVMPSARRALKERGLRAEDIEPSGPGGRLLKEDVERARVPVPAADMRVRAPQPAELDRIEEVVPMSPFRRRIAERLVQSQQTAALLTTFN